MTIFDWAQDHWPEVLTYIGLGGGSGLLGKKITDKKQDDKINRQGKEISLLKETSMSHTETIALLKNDLQNNTEWDKQLRSDLKIHREELNAKFTKLEEDQIRQFTEVGLGQKELLNHIIELIKKS